MQRAAAALTPDLALAYLRELSTDLVAAAVLDARGGALAGAAPFAAAAAELAAALPEDRVVAVPEDSVTVVPEDRVATVPEDSAGVVPEAAAGMPEDRPAGPGPPRAGVRVTQLRAGNRLVTAARSARHTVVCVHTRHALAALVGHDAATVACDLDGGGTRPPSAGARAAAPVVPDAVTAAVVAAADAVDPAAERRSRP